MAHKKDENCRRKLTINEEIELLKNAAIEERVRKAAEKERALAADECGAQAKIARRIARAAQDSLPRRRKRKASILAPARRRARISWEHAGAGREELARSSS